MSDQDPKDVTEPVPRKPKDDYNFIPTTYQELWDHYFTARNGRPPIARTLVRQLLKHGSDEELTELTRDTYLRMQAQDMIKRYDPAQANFGGMVFVCARSVTTAYLSKKTRDPLGLLYGGTVTDEASEPNTFARGVYHLDKLNRGRQDEPAEAYEAKELLRMLLDMCETKAANAKSLRDQSLPRLLDLLYQELTPKEIAEELGVTQSTVSNWIKLLGEMARSPYRIYARR